jgi:hypothetical protein
VARTVPNLTIDGHAVARAKLVERMAARALQVGIEPDDLQYQTIRTALANAASATVEPSETTWALLTIRLGGDL